MPNFDGKGPLKRGRVIGRGRGPCGQGGLPPGDEQAGEEKGKERTGTDRKKKE